MSKKITSESSASAFSERTQLNDRGLNSYSLRDVAQEAASKAADQEMLKVIANSEEHRYQNIFGGQNTYDQVMTQVNQNITST